MNNKTPLSTQSLIEVKNLSFNRGERVIYDNISLNIRRGQITAIMGPSGTGKTTLLRLIGGQLVPDQGEVLLDGKDIAQMSRQELFAARARMGMLFQSGALFTDMSVYENVAFPIRAHTKLSENLIAELVALKLESVGLRGT
ncbi:ATP-binding cassette domain-containing protein, partial [Acinetobacter baumannii]